MKTFWTIQIGIGVAAIAGFAAFGVACGSSTTTDTDESDTCADATDDTDCVDTDTDTSDTDTSDTDTSDSDPCECACVTLMSAGGCADLCSTEHNGASSPNFCEGSSALTMCASCLASSCPDSVSASCSGM